MNKLIKSLSSILTGMALVFGLYLLFVSVSCNTEVEEPEIESIQVETWPTKRDYIFGEEIDLTGIKVIGIYEGSHQTVPITDFTITGVEEAFSGEEGNKHITVHYGELTAWFGINVWTLRDKCVEITKLPNKLKYYIGEEIDTTGMVVSVVRTDGTKYEVKDYTVSYTAYFSGTTRATVSYKIGDVFWGADFEIEVEEVKLLSIEVTTLPNKMNYFAGEKFDPTGMVVTATYNNGKTCPVDDYYTSYNFYGDSGKRTVTISRYPLSTELTVNVTAVEIESIEITKLPEKLSYYEGDSLDITGMEVVGTKNDGSKIAIEEYSLLFDYDFSVSGTRTVTVSLYNGKSDTFTVEVAPVVLNSIEVSTKPNKLNYFVGDALSTDGMKVKGVFNNGSREVTGWEATADLSVSGTRTVTVTYGGKTATFTVEVKEIAVVAIQITTPAQKQTYYAGDALNTYGMVVTGINNNGSRCKLTGWEATADLTVAGTRTVTVTYGKLTTTFTVEVTAVTLQSISILKPTKLNYYSDEELDTTGMEVYGKFSNGSRLITGWKATADLTVAGTRTVTVSYGGKTATFTVNVTAVQLNSIEITTMPAKLSYFSDERLDTTGMVVTGHYNNGSRTVTGWTTSVDLTVGGVRTVVVKFGGRQTSYKVNVTEVVLESITISTKPTKLSYYTFDELDTTGMVVTGNYNSGSKTVVGWETSSDLTTAGTKTVTVSYGEKTATYSVNVVDAILESLEVTKLPKKLSYFNDEQLVTTGMEISGTYNNGTRTVTGWKATADLTIAGTRTVTVSYGGKTTTYTVEVTAVVLKSIEITKKPYKLAYYVKDTLSTTGLQVTGTNNNGTTFTVTDWNIEAYDFTTEGKKVVTVAYGGKTATYEVEVMPSDFVKVTGVSGSNADFSSKNRSFTIPDLIACKHEVTQKEYEMYGSYEEGHAPSSNYGLGSSTAAYYITWSNAIEYCNKRSLAEGFTPCYNGETCDFTADGYRLPTEAEWVYLARGGESYSYAGSNTIDDVAWYEDNTVTPHRCSDVMFKKPNGYGLYDMTGNVQEWCYDWYGEITSSTPSTGPKSGSQRVIRGGGALSTYYNCYISQRNSSEPFFHTNNIYMARTFGFRVVRTAIQR